MPLIKNVSPYGELDIPLLRRILPAGETAEATDDQARRLLAQSENFAPADESAELIAAELLVSAADDNATESKGE